MIIHHEPQPKAQTNKNGDLIPCDKKASNKKGKERLEHYK